MQLQLQVLETVNDTINRLQNKYVQTDQEVSEILSSLDIFPCTCQDIIRT